KGVKYAIGEFGGYTNYIGKRRFYPIMVAEKQGCGITATVRGQGGHGAWPARGGIMHRVARLLGSLEHRLPVHITPVAKEQIRTTAEGLPTPFKQTFMQMLIPALTNSVLDTLGSQVRMFDPILHNTAAVTVIKGGENYNVIPSQVQLALDCRLNLPPEINFEQLFHAADERVPIKALEFGADAIYSLLQKFGN
ncbi:MAG: peptidase dimerization domain-containing protein, partial [Chloroflexi bacterium]|nr:peptidase dimerization domain-containing protein [Chloroflexota bacterium]